MEIQIENRSAIWIQPVKVARKPRVMAAKETKKANVAKNCLILTMMSLELGFGSVIERYQSARDAVVERYHQDGPGKSTYLATELLTDEERTARTADQPDEAVVLSLAPASMPPPTCLLKGKEAEALNQVHAVALKDTSLKMYHVMSVKQTLREDLAECAYQFSCRAADWSRSDMHAVPMQFEPLELHVIDALGQQEVPDYFQQPAKAITEDVSVMKGPYAQEWIAAVLEEIESFKRLGVYEEVPRGHSPPPRPPVTLHCEWPYLWLLTWDGQWNAGTSPRLFSTRAYLGTGIQTWVVMTYMRPPRILVETNVVAEGVVWKIKKALYGLRTSPIAWETERDNTLKTLQWVHEDVTYRLFPCQGSPCLWTVVPIRTGEDPSVKSPSEELTRGVVITYV